MKGSAAARQLPQGAVKPGPFAIAAQVLSRMNVAVLPLGGEDGKHPLVSGWTTWKRPPGTAFIDKQIAQHPEANIGIACGLSRVTVIDIDDPNLIGSMIERFGDTPLKTHTPRGGVHLWYRNNGEGCSQQLRREGLAVDVKGIGGFIVVPPSVRWNGDYAGRPYGFLRGTWRDLSRIPTMRPGALNARAEAKAGGIVPLRAVREGARNIVLFSRLLRQVKGCDDAEALCDVAQTINSDFDPPLDIKEILKTVMSVWEYEANGRNWVGKEQRVFILKSEREKLGAYENGADAEFLLVTLKFAHWDRDTFAASPKAMAEAQIIPGWGHGRYRKALATLTEAGLLMIVHPGGRGTGDPRLFSFADAAARKGTGSVPNIIITPFPPFLPCLCMARLQMADLASRAAARVLSRCRRAGVRVILLNGKIFAGFATGADGVYGWLPPPRKLGEAIQRHESDIRQLLGDNGSSRPWSVEWIGGDCLLIFAPFGSMRADPQRLQRQ